MEKESIENHTSRREEAKEALRIIYKWDDQEGSQLELDKIVIDHFSQLASDTNNQGMLHQIEILLSEGWTSDEILSQLNLQE